MGDSSGQIEALRRLNGKQLRFVDEYLHDFQVNKAAWRAGYCKTDRRAGTRLLQLPHVHAEIQRRCLEAQVRLDVTLDHIRQGFARIAFDPREESAGGPSRLERIASLRELGKLLGGYMEQNIFVGVTLEQLLAQASQTERTLPAPTPPLRLINGGKT